jgi:hypothetical protein
MLTFFSLHGLTIDRRKNKSIERRIAADCHLEDGEAHHRRIRRQRPAKKMLFLFDRILGLKHQSLNTAAYLIYLKTQTHFLTYQTDLLIELVKSRHKLNG